MGKSQLQNLRHYIHCKTAQLNALIVVAYKVHSRIFTHLQMIK